MLPVTRSGAYAPDTLTYHASRSVQCLYHVRPRRTIPLHNRNWARLQPHWGRARVEIGEAHRLKSFSVEELEDEGQIPTPSGDAAAGAVAAGSRSQISVSELG